MIVCKTDYATEIVIIVISYTADSRFIHQKDRLKKIKENEQRYNLIVFGVWNRVFLLILLRFGLTPTQDAGAKNNLFHRCLLKPEFQVFRHP